MYSRSWIFAVAWAVALGSGAGAAAAGPVDYVKVCDAYGDGFFYIPGTETCMSIGGYVRAEARAFAFNRNYSNWLGNRTNTSAADDTGSWGSSDPRDFRFDTLARANLNIDARTATEFGLLRSYAEIQWTVNTVPNTAGTAGGAVQVELEKAFVQWGGLTAGRAQSFFDFWTGNREESFFHIATSDRNTNLVAWTQTLGQGLTASISIEDGTFRRGEQNDADDGGNKWPDLVIALAGKGSWGKAQVMAALHQNVGTADNANKSAWGYAIGAGLELKMPTGHKDKLHLQGAFGRGASDYIANEPFYPADFGDFGNTDQRIRKHWSLAAGYTHHWSDEWATSLEASLFRDYGQITPTSALFPSAAMHDYRQVDLQGSLDWTPTKEFTISLIGEYRRVDFDTDRNRFIRDRTKPGSPPAGVRNMDAFVGAIRFERHFGGDDD